MTDSRKLTREEVLRMFREIHPDYDPHEQRLADGRVVLGANGTVEVAADEEGVPQQVFVRTTVWLARPGLVIRNIGPQEKEEE